MGKFQNTSQIALHLTLVFSATFILSQPIQAKCDLTASINEEFNRSDSVFVGQVSKTKEISIVKNRRSYRGTVFTFSVDETFKGIQNSTIDVKSFALNGESYFDFKEGEKYLVYAGKNPKTGDLTASGCTRTALLNKAVEDIIGIRLISFFSKSDWMGIIPAISDRSDVEKLFGECEGGQSMICFYEMDLGKMIVSYNSRGFCNGEPRDVSKEKVLSVTFMLETDITIKNLSLDLKQFTEEKDVQVPGLQYYNYEEKTLVLNSTKESEKAEQFIYAFRFLPTPAQLKELKCEK